MHTMTDHGGAALIIGQRHAGLVTAVAEAVRADGWQVHSASAPEDIRCAAAHPVQALIYIPDLLSADRGPEPAAVLVDALEALGPSLDNSAAGGARVVAVSSRDWLGWPTRPRSAAAAAGLIAAVRSLALAQGRRGITVNAVVGLADSPGDAPDCDSNFREPESLTGEPVTTHDVGRAVTFFLDPRSSYITGQVLQCCGGSGLLSSMSA